MIKALIIGLMIGLLAFVSFGHTTEITFENCTPGASIGITRFINDGADFEYVEDGRLMQQGSLVIDLPPGNYGITYRVPYAVTSYGVRYVLVFEELTVGNTKINKSFGCEE